MMKLRRGAVTECDQNSISARDLETVGSALRVVRVVTVVEVRGAGRVAERVPINMSLMSYKNHECWVDSDAFCSV